MEQSSTLDGIVSYQTIADTAPGTMSYYFHISVSLSYSRFTLDESERVTDRSNSSSHFCNLDLSINQDIAWLNCIYMHKFLWSWQNILKSKRSIIHIYITFLPSVNEVWGKVIFSQAAIVLSTGGQLGLYPGWSPSRRICIGEGGLHAEGLGRPPQKSDTTGCGRQAGGIQPTGMHSCFKMWCYSDFVVHRNPGTDMLFRLQNC